MPTSSLRLHGEPDLRDRTADWLAATLQQWSLPGQLSRTWLPAVERGLGEGGAVEVALDYDPDMGLLSVEVRDVGGRVLVGLDDFVGQF
ncbi:MAG: hypothetical protein M3P93_14560 [Actinomycetota bacterium]|nr:hypothetical protein [Actinomycetota bacterium]